MDADTLRLILIVAGGVLLAGLYIRERRRARPDVDEPSADEDSDEDKLEPQLGAWHDGETGIESGDVALHDTGDRPESPLESEQPEPESPPAALDEVAQEGPESPLILSFHITSAERIFDGKAIVHAASRCGIEPGEMDIFHCFADSESAEGLLFSVANMVKPGTFPFGAMAEFESPGLTLFSQAEGAPDDPGRLEAMLVTAHCLANELDAEIQDGNRKPLTHEMEQRLRDKVFELVTWRLSNPIQE